MQIHSGPTKDAVAPRVCPWWVAYTFDNPLRPLIHNPRKIFQGLVEEGMTVLDLGAGLGYFSIAMARLVGAEGRVIAVDIQDQMLRRLGRRAARKRLSERIALHKAEPTRIGVDDKVDFALAFWMVHEVPDQAVFLAEVRDALKPGGKLLVAEPRMHVSDTGFRDMVHLARTAGLQPVAPVPVALSRTMLFTGGGEVS